MEAFLEGLGIGIGIGIGIGTESYGRNLSIPSSQEVSAVWDGVIKLVSRDSPSM